MGPFIYESLDFEKELIDSRHLSEEVRILTSIAEPGMQVIDVGTNRGVAAVALAKKVQSHGHVYTFEPVPEYYTVAEQNISRNGLDNVSIYQKALTNEIETIRFYKHGGGSGITDPPDEEANDTDIIRVETTTIDNFVAEQEIDRIDILSMDCEGSELYVFQGAKTVLAEHGPQIFCEIHHFYLEKLGQSAKQVVEYLQSFDYDVELIQVESSDKRPAIGDCSHIYARKPLRENNTSSDKSDKQT